MKNNLYVKTLKFMVETAWYEYTFRGYLYAILTTIGATIKFIFTLGRSARDGEQKIYDILNESGVNFEEFEHNFYDGLEEYIDEICG